MADENTTTDDKAGDLTPEERQEATNMGWVDKPDFKGDPDAWVDAKTYVDKGRHVMPILRKNNERLQGIITNQNAELEKINLALQESRDSIQALEEYHGEETKRRVEEARKQLKEQLKQAKKDGNTDAEVDITDELTQLNSAESVADRKAQDEGSRGNGADRITQRPPIDPEFQAWAAENSWYGKDLIRTDLAFGVANRLRAQGDRTIGRAFMEKVTEGTNAALKSLGGSPGHNKVEEDRGGGNNRRSLGKTFSDLSAEAQAACHSWNERLVGPNRVHKTVADWEKAYTAKYLEGEAQ